MKKKMLCTIVKKITILSIFFIFNSINFLFAQTENYSDILYKYFVDEGFYIQRQFLENSPSTSFPYNLSFSFAPEYTAEDENQESSIVLLIPQEVAFSYKEAIKNLTQHLLYFPLKCEIQIFLTADDSSILPKKIRRGMPSGTNTAISSLKENSILILFSSSDYFYTTNQSTIKQNHDIRIFAGANGKTTPLSLIKNVYDFVDSTNLTWQLYGDLFFIYRLNLIASSNRLEAAVNTGLPSIELVLKNEDIANKVFSSLPMLLENQANNINTDGQFDINYVRIGYKSYNIWISETIFILVMVIFSGVALLILFMFSFVGKTNSSQYLKDFSKTWFLIPILIIICALCLTVGQQFATLFFPDPSTNIAGTLIIKIIFTIVLISILFLFRQFINFPFNQFVYGYLLTLISFLNIFIFATISLSLLIIFLAEYIIVYIFRPAKRIWSLILATIFMILPYIPIVFSIFQFGDPQRTSNMVVCSIQGNFLASFLFIPFLLMWIRILVHLKSFGKIYYYSIGKIIVDVFFIAGATIIVIISAIILSNFSAENSLKEQNLKTVNSDADEITISQRTTDYLDVSTHYFNIETQTQPIRYDITLNLPADKLIYNSDFPFERYADGRTVFYLDEYPKKELIFSFSTSRDTDYSFLLLSYFLKTENGIDYISIETDTFLYADGIITQIQGDIK